jgi:hypothetical protein
MRLLQRLFDAYVAASVVTVERDGITEPNVIGCVDAGCVIVEVPRRAR